MKKLKVSKISSEIDLSDINIKTTIASSLHKKECKLANGTLVYFNRKNNVKLKDVKLNKAKIK